MCSKVDSQCVSNTTTVSGASRSITSVRRRCSPGTRLISLPSLISSRTASGSMIVGTCATSPAPTISPISASLSRRDDRVLHVGVEVEAPHATLPADPGVARPAEGRVQIADEEAVDPHGPGDETIRNPVCTLGVTRVERGGEAEVGRVRKRDSIVLVDERLRREHGAEHLLREDLRAGRRVREQRRTVVEAAELRGDTATEHEPGAVRLRATDEPVDALQVLPRDQGPEVGRLVPWVAQTDRRRGSREALDEIVVDRALDQETRARQADLAGVVELVD